MMPLVNVHHADATDGQLQECLSPIVGFSASAKATSLSLDHLQRPVCVIPSCSALLPRPQMHDDHRRRYPACTRSSIRTWRDFGLQAGIGGNRRWQLQQIVVRRSSYLLFFSTSLIVLWLMIADGAVHLDGLGIVQGAGGLLLEGRLAQRDLRSSAP